MKAALERELGTVDEVRIHVTKPNSRGQRAAIIQLKEEQVQKLYKLNKIKVKWSTNCRVPLSQSL